ncbi:hypothetical protein [Microvirga rosea]|uniref:hypothetical protein n=1 Tax=Microvirga rosea TaxID=2715425 RepID=UPI001D0A6502|nr:hypothetical protein [Microvirga rosea]MCB8819937.1 hypothetical protein [Microvirga rosea]
MTVLSAERTITIPMIAHASAQLCPALLREAEQHGFLIDGPWIFVSHDLPTDQHTEFRVEFCLPVSAGIPYQGNYALKSLAPILCASGRYNGPLQDLFSDGYGPLLRSITSAGHVLSGESREIYHRWQGPDLRDNQIEIQFGLRQ